MAYGKLPPRTAAHGIACDRKLRQREFRCEGVHEVRQALAAEYISLRSARQPVTWEIEAHHMEPPFQFPYPPLPAGKGIPEAVQQHQQRPVRIALILIVHVKFAG